MNISAIEADITTQNVDAIVNAANTGMRGGGGVDGAIHRAAGPQLLEECIERFPHGLATGDAGWTHGYNLPARYVIHTPGPNYRAGQRDRSLLESSYRRCLEVADDLGIKTIAFPLISAGVYGWPLEDACTTAVHTIAVTPCDLESVYLVALDAAIVAKLQNVIATL